MTTRIADNSGAPSPGGVVTVLRLLALTVAALTTGLISGFFYAYACSVTLGLGLLSDAQYVEAMQAINATVRNGVFALSFFGAVLALLLALAVHAPRPRSRRFLLLAACLCALRGRRFPAHPPGERADERGARRGG